MASHFTEEIAGYKFSYGIAVSQIDGSVDGMVRSRTSSSRLSSSRATRVLVSRLKNPLAPP